MNRVIINLELRYEQDLVLARQRVRQIAELLGFDRQEQTRVATAVSEIVRNAFEYGGGGKIEIGVSLVDPRSPWYLITVRDSGAGIADLQSILDGRYVSKTGLGLGMIGARRLMERFEVDSKPGLGTQVVLGKPLPKSTLPFETTRLGEIAGELARKSSQNPLQEVQLQNQELMSALEELQLRQAELARLNLELEETNRGVVALYAELDEKAASLKRASEAKTSFLSDMTHEFRTPLNSILGLSRAALSEVDGPLHPEHRKQLQYIQSSATTLSGLVNDLLDIAKVEAGKVDVRPVAFDVDELFGGLRGVLKPLTAVRLHVGLFFDSPPVPISLHTDEGKVGQILRNLVSNALKYTENGEVRVRARVDGSHLEFIVRDTGIGIAATDLDRIFDEFIQIESKLQRFTTGTGLGLSLSRKLATLLGGTLTVSSQPGQGSEFILRIPARFSASETVTASLSSGPPEPAPGPGLRRTLSPELRVDAALPLVLMIDDEEVSRYLLKELLSFSSIRLLEASDGFVGIRLAEIEHPRVIFLDLQMPAMSGFYVIERLRANPLTRDIPIIVHTAMNLSESERQELLKNVLTIIPKASTSREDSRAWVREALARVGIGQASTAQEVTHG